MTEPGAGSDLGGMKTRAEDRGDHWVLNGSKTYISNGYIGDLFVVAARTDPPTGAMGIGLFLVEAGIAGLQRGRKLKKMGSSRRTPRSCSSRTCKVPKANMLGEPGMGFMLPDAVPAEERLLGAVGYLAAAADCVRPSRSSTSGTARPSASRWARSRTPGSSSPRCAPSSTRAQAFIDHCVQAHNAGKLTAGDGRRGQAAGQRLEGRVMDECVQLHGGAGYMEEYRIARMYTDARVSRIYAGSSEMMKEIIGRSLGLDDRKRSKG